MSPASAPPRRSTHRGLPIAIAERALIVNADEFGLTEHVNYGIIEAHQRGAVTSTTMLANMWAFEHAAAPVDVYGVGSSLMRGENDFTADVVLVEGRPGGKRGRPYRPNPRLEPVE